MNGYCRKRGGYTILEVIIVLSVSAMLFASSLAAYSQQNRRTQFTESVNTFSQNIQDVLNDVETGFYPSDSSFSCAADPSGVINSGYPYFPTGGTAQQGTNSQCIFVGKAIQFGPAAATKSDVDIYTIVGRRLIAGSTSSVAFIDDARPVGLTKVTDRKSLTADVEVINVKTTSGTTLAGFAMVSTSSGSGGISTGLNSRASLASISGSLSENQTTFLGQISGLNSSSIDQAKNGINICLQEQGGGRYALIQLAAGESQIIVNTKIDTPPC